MNLSPGVIGTLVAFAVPLGLAAFVAFWCLICFVVARIGGWHALATRFPAGAQTTLGVQWYQWQTMDLGASEYRGTANIGVGPNGLYLSAMVLFSVGHARICIPWSAITRVKTEKRWWMTVHELSVPLEKFNTATITLYNAGLASAIAQYAPSVVAVTT